MYMCRPGSPPHARGKGYSGVIFTFAIRITPARAGKSYGAGKDAGGYKDHPRTRGEKLSSSGVALSNLGSPPHARGKVGMPFLCRVIVGITPARAGKSYSSDRHAVPLEDHPRTRGEKLSSNSGFTSLSGSPPHARGKGGSPECPCGARRITPARAGKRHEERTGNCGCWDHPRTRGEKAPVSGSMLPLKPSPPHARGKGYDRPEGIHLCGITPARAGKRRFAKS